MTPEERNLLQTFLGDLQSTRGGLKDAEADQMIGQALRANPDAPYLLVQHAILADQALHAAQAQIAGLQDQLRGAPAGQPTSFLGQPAPGAGPWGQAAPARPGSFVGAGPFSGGGGGLGSFLRNAGTTAVGVAGGSLLFEGLSGLFGGGRGGGFGGFGGGFGGGMGVPTENVTINNYGDGGGDDGGGVDTSDWGNSDDGF